MTKRPEISELFQRRDVRTGPLGLPRQFTADEHMIQLRQGRFGDGQILIRSPR